MSDGGVKEEEMEPTVIKNDATDTDIGARLKEGREAAGLTLGQAARILELSVRDLEAIEAGKRSVQATELIKFSDVYAISVDWILGEWGDNDVPQEWVDMMEKLPVGDRRKLLRAIAMIGKN